MVADEVRKLAEQSAKRASEITSLTHTLAAKSSIAQKKAHEGESAVK